MTDSNNHSPQASAIETAWSRLEHYHQDRKSVRLKQLFSQDPDRAQRYSVAGCGLYLDYSKNRIDDKCLELLLVLARDAELENWIERLFAGESVNTSEQRPAMHMALRSPEKPAFPDPAQNLMPLVHEQLKKLEKTVEQLHCGQWLGFRGDRITDLVNLGIGGSDHGPRMVCEALSMTADGALQRSREGAIRCHFVSNCDVADLYSVLEHCDPATTLFVVASKSFTTQETLLNAHSARRWLLQAHGADAKSISQHFIAVSNAPDRCIKFGIAEENIFKIWDWVGGRYSLWSSIGIAIAVQAGMAQFRQLLAGAWAMDKHFSKTPLAQNLPVLLALIGIWNRNFEGASSQAVLPYEQALKHFPEYLQQLEMESNGKSCSREGVPLNHLSAPVVWGALGSNAQHAFNQLLHQGSEKIPVDFIVPIFSQQRAPEHQQALLANALAQSAVMLSGHDASDLRDDLLQQGTPESSLESAIVQRSLAGNRTSNMLIYERLDAKTLGSLIALYEHKVFVQGVCWQINSFDQWGVELGKRVAKDLHSALSGESAANQFDASTRSLIRYIRDIRNSAAE